ncbi:MAG: ABC transporter permease, partial [Sciscionella sp.]|nr:ABC transporter permease [Sciscionella sp.]
RLPTNPKVLAGIAIFVIFALTALIGPAIVANGLGLDPHTLYSTDALAPPSAAHPLGTSVIGEDVLAQLVTGSRASLLVALVAAAVSTGIAVLVGVTGAYLGGLVDAGLTALTNVALVIPGLPLLIVVGSYVRGHGGWLLVALIIGLTSWPWGARAKRAQTLSLRERDFVTAAELTGESRWRVITHELIPNLAPLIGSSFLTAIILSLFADASLAYIGVGNINTLSWGEMLYSAQQSQALAQGAWWWFVPPGACIALVGVGAALLNFGLDEISNPRLRVAHRRLARRARKAARARALPAGVGQAR